VDLRLGPAGGRGARRWGWRLQALTPDHTPAFQGQEFNATLAALGVEHISIRAGRSTSQGCLERLQQTFLEEGGKPVFAPYLTPTYTGLRCDLERERLISNIDRAPQGGAPTARLPRKP
jgi:hypothetical protein